LSSVAVHEAADGVLSSAEGVEVDYLEVLRPDELAPAPRWLPVDAQLLVAIAAFIGDVRLIDNVVVGDAEDEDRILTAAS
jgi:pantoate--beta-alanine ligase